MEIGPGTKLGYQFLTLSIGRIQPFTQIIVGDSTYAFAYGCEKTAARIVDAPCRYGRRVELLCPEFPADGLYAAPPAKPGKLVQKVHAVGAS